jgi:segregation and condensation protein B
MLKSKIEAILFLTDKPIRAQAIARIVNEDVQLVRQAILELVHDYEERTSGLEIADDNGYIIQVKDEYASITDEFIPMDLPIPLLRTLSAVAIKQPVAQSEIIKIRGGGAYDHIKELIIRELIVKKEEGGRSPLLLTTKQFQEYFRLSHDAKSLRTELRKEDKAEAQLLQAEQASADNLTQLELELKPAPAAISDSPGQLDEAPGAAPDSPEHLDQAPGAAPDSPEHLDQAPAAISNSPGQLDEAPAAASNVEEQSAPELVSKVEAPDVAPDSLANDLSPASDKKDIHNISVSDPVEDFELHPHVEKLEQIFASSPDASLVFRHPNDVPLALTDTGERKPLEDNDDDKDRP